MTRTKRRTLDAMGMEITITRTPKRIDLRRMYDIVHVLEDGFDWWLGDGVSKSKAEKWKELHDFAFSLKREDILDAELRLNSTKTPLATMPTSDFNHHLAWVLGAIKEHQEGDTHLFIDYDALPGVDVLTVCSWTMRSIMLRFCNKGTSKVEDDIDELSLDKARSLALTWSKGASDLKLNIARWVGYFVPAASARMVKDMARSLSIEDEGELDLNDIALLKEGIMKVADSLKDGERLWMISSY